ncbi:hypothetical protein CDL12_08272 [Handroanthus impetiginosus]|uniref:Uncharacterized protein n=1 Tax=Handroanthus impetiginosus TaxID=429701 RepID=A0A2G9HNG2_9LAMI|nr:hypothetical protein CDL12_08272 [Handroanthus impetiginosus]
MQVSRALKLLGFKVPAKAKIQNSDAPGPPSRGAPQILIILLQGKFILKKTHSFLCLLWHSRKRVQAFSVGQEQKIKDLFEQFIYVMSGRFKDHKRRSYMIANALDETGKISGARVSQKLKQLGLVGPKQKRSHANLHFMAEVFSDVSFTDFHIVTNSLLSVLLETIKAKEMTSYHLSFRGIQKRNGRHSGEGNSKKIAQKLPEDTSDDELLSSVPPPKNI